MKKLHSTSADTLYATKQMVMAFHEEYVKHTKKYPRLPETLLLMKERGLLSADPLPMPQIHGLMPIPEFQKAYEQIPFEANRIMYGEPEEGAISESSIFPKDRDVFCVQHFHNFGAYTPQVDNFFTVTCIFKGTCHFHIGKHSITLEPGDICIIPPGSEYLFQPHTDTFAFEAIIRFSSFNLMFGELLTTNTSLSNFLSNALMKRYYENFFLIRMHGHDDELRMYIQAFAAECINEDEYANTCAVSLMKLFLTRAYRKYKDNAFIYQQDMNHLRPDAKAILEYIQNNYRDVTLAKTADVFHYNKTYLSRLIQNYFGKSFIQIVTELKIARAKDYLKHSNHRISDIALLTGYDSPDHFSRTFKKETGMAPAFYRRKYNAEHRL